jgi:hypothetical protein
VDMILFDWTRMGRSYCVAGAVWQDKGWRVVRPMLSRFREAPVRNVGWSAYLMDGHARWEIMELIDVKPAAPEPPHLEDVWVRAMKSRRSSASREQRRFILAATTVPPEEPLFGADIASMRTAAYVPPGSGTRSLATLVVPTEAIHFDAIWREGTPRADIRVQLPLPKIGIRSLPVKDHVLLRKAERASPDEDQQLQFLTDTVEAMGQQVAVRLGLSRPFAGPPNQPGVCWVMADGFFSVLDPQP